MSHPAQTELVIETGRTESQYRKDLWRYRDFFYFLAWRDILGRYKQTAIATGESHKLEDFVAAAFACVWLDWREHVVIDTSLLRPTDIAVGRGNPAKARKQLGWQAQ